VEESIPNDHYWTEQALAASPLGWTVLRNNIYAETILMGLPPAVASGQLFTAARNGGRNYVTREDCARAAAAALTSDFGGRRILDVTGPEPVTQDEIAAIAGEMQAARSGTSRSSRPLSARVWSRPDCRSSMPMSWSASTSMLRRAITPSRRRR
jgi:uncharacterized protein YbjT (DUF2867 family)